MRTWCLLLAAWLLVGGAAALAQEALIAAGDVIELTVNEESDLSGKFRVGDDGRLSLPLAGTFAAGGMTCPQLAEAVKASLARYLKNPMLTLAVAEHSRRMVSVAGAVRSPGSYEIGPSSTLLQAIGLAGGPLPEANLSQVRLMRGGQGTVYDLNRYSRQDDASQNPQVLPGDDILVEQTRHYFVTGAVNRPGAYLPTPGLTLAEALAMAGGYTPRAELAGAVLTKASGEKVPVDMAGLARGNLPSGVTVGPGDALFVPEANTMELTLIGGFRQAGRIFVPSTTSVVDLLALAGGAESGAKTKEMRVVRQEQGKPVSIKVDLDDYLRSPSPQKLQAMALRPGDVVYLPSPQPRREGQLANLGWLSTLLYPLLW